MIKLCSFIPYLQPQPSCWSTHRFISDESSAPTFGLRQFIPMSWEGIRMQWGDTLICTSARVTFITLPIPSSTDGMWVAQSTWMTLGSKAETPAPLWAHRADLFPWASSIGQQVINSFHSWNRKTQSHNLTSIIYDQYLFECLTLPMSIISIIFFFVTHSLLGCYAAMLKLGCWPYVSFLILVCNTLFSLISSIS